MSHTMKGNQGQGLPDGILKQKGNNTMYGQRPRSDMQTIKERETHYDDESGYSDFKENTDLNALDQSNATLSMSLRDPNRRPQVVPGLARFLQEEHDKKFGVQTENPKDLLQFWRNYVSIQHIKERNAKRSNLDGDSMLQAGGFSMLGGGSPKKYSSMANPKYKGGASIGKQAAPKKIHDHLGEYAKYGDNSKVFEFDVIKSCEAYMNEEADEQAKKDLHYAAQQQKKREATKKAAQRKKIKDMIDTFYDVKKILLLKEKIKNAPKPKAPIGGKSFKESRSKSPAAKKLDDKGQKSSEKPKVAEKSDSKPKVDEKKIEKPSYSIRPQTAKANKGKSLDLKQSGPPSKLTLEIEKLSAHKCFDNDKAALRKIDDQIENEKRPIWTIMKINHDGQFMKYRAYADRCELMDRQKLEHFEKRREWEKKNPGKDYPHALEQGQKEKAPFSMLCDVESIFKEYIQNKDSTKDGKRLYDDIPGGATKVNELLVDFFKPENIVRRILYYRDHINKSERRGQITLHSFFLNTIIEDQQLYMFYVSPQRVKDDEGDIVNISSDQVAKQYIAAFEYDMDQKAQKQQEALAKKLTIKEEKYKVQVNKQVFGDKWNPETGIKTTMDKFKTKEGEWISDKTKNDYYALLAKPKDKWKVGRELKQLAKEFPHDRVIQRMVQEEFKTNQPFMYPEEYDVFDQGQEKQIKNVFANKGEQGLQSAPNFEQDQSKWDNFNSADAPNFNGTKYQKKQEGQAEYKLEKQLQDLALNYHQQMANRSSGNKKPETLRSLLAHYFNQILKVHGKVAQKRFPHVAYGQDPKSETFKKSFPSSFKMYFFKLVKSIIVTVKNKKQTVQYCKKPGSMIMAVGARESKIEDPVGVKTFNKRLQPFSLKMGVGAHMKFEPKTWRARAWRRNDKREAMKAIFMQQSEIENCTFEPTVQTMLKNAGSNIRPEAPIGEFFSDKRQGKNFTLSQPKLFKKGILKRARADMKQGNKPFQVIMSNLGGAFNLLSVMQYYRPADTKVWKNGIEAKQNNEKLDKEAKDAKQFGKQSTLNMNEAQKKLQQPELQKNLTQVPEVKKDLSADERISKLTLEEKAQEFDMTIDAIRDITDAFNLYAKKEKTDPANKAKKIAQLSVRPDLDNAMRKLGHTPGEVELNEIRNQLDDKKQQEMRDVKHANKKQQDEDRLSGKKRDEIVCQIKGIDLHWFTIIMKDKMVELTTQSELKDAFKILDEDGSGQIDADEFEKVLSQLGQFSPQEIKGMIEAADTDRSGDIDEVEFIKVMQGAKGKNKEMMQKMKLNLKRYLNQKKDMRLFEQMKPEIKWILNTIKKQNDSYYQQNRKAKPSEDISEANKSVMDDVWELLQYIINEQKNKFDKKKMYEKQKTKLEEQMTGYKDQKEGGYQKEEKGEDGKEDDDDDKDYLKIFKTIMCPLGNSCANRRKQRWPYTSLKNTTKLGFKCPFAHHAMELNFPQTLGVRNKVNQRLLDKATDKPDDMAEEGASKFEEFKYSGSLNPCLSHCGRCNYCAFKQLAKESTEKITVMKTTMAISADRVEQKGKQNEEDTNNFARKFGILKKASVLSYYGRPNDCFDALIPAIKIIQEQQKNQNEKNDMIKRKWELKLGCPDIELPKDYKKIRLEDLTDDFLKHEAFGNSKAEMKMLLHKICPLIRDIGDRNVFLNGLIEDLFYECEDKLKGMQTGIEKIKKNVEKLVTIKDQLGDMGSDAEKEGNNVFTDDNGIEIKMKKVRRKMCTSVQRRVDYSQKYLSYKAEPEGKKMKDQKVRLEMKTDKKYYMDTKLNKKKRQDANGRSCTIVCDKGKDCNLAHYPIQLDLLPLDKQIKNLKGAMKAQDTLMKNDRPMEPWRPCASDFKVNEQDELAKRKKKKGEKEEAEDDTKKKKRLFERENPFDKPWKGDN